MFIYYLFIQISQHICSYLTNFENKFLLLLINIVNNLYALLSLADARIYYKCNQNVCVCETKMVYVQTHYFSFKSFFFYAYMYLHMYVFDLF